MRCCDREPRKIYSQDEITKIAENCNKRANAAKAAQEQSGHVFLCALVHKQYD